MVFHMCMPTSFCIFSKSMHKHPIKYLFFSLLDLVDVGTGIAVPHCLGVGTKVGLENCGCGLESQSSYPVRNSELR